MACNSIVVVREVWDTRDLVGAPLEDDGAIRVSALQTRFEPEDLNALEAALRLKDAQGGKVTAVSVGAPRQVEVLRECLYRGVDEVFQVDADPGNLDDQALAALLAAALRKLGTPDLILVGTSVVDGENAMLGAVLAAELNWDHVAWVDAVESVADGLAIVKRAVEMGYETIATPLPSVISIGVALLEDDPRAPRPAKAMLKLKMKKAAIPSASPADLGVTAPESLITTRITRRAPIPERIIETRVVDPENVNDLKAMLADLLQGR